MLPIDKYKRKFRSSSLQNGGNKPDRLLKHEIWRQCNARRRDLNSVGLYIWSPICKVSYFLRVFYKVDSDVINVMTTLHIKVVFLTVSVLHLGLKHHKTHIFSHNHSHAHTVWNNITRILRHLAAQRVLLQLQGLVAIFTPVFNLISPLINGH